jgi:hypothetical protein
VYRAETPLPSSPLPGLEACAAFAAKVVGTLWWQARFEHRDLGSIPVLCPGNRARRAFYREGPPSITLPRRYRTKGVVLHELVHWALGIAGDLPHHGRTFARVLLDATEEFRGRAAGDELAASFGLHRVHVGAPPRATPDGHLRYGWDERLHLARGRVVTVACQVVHTDHTHAASATFVGRFEGYDRGRRTVRLTTTDGPVAIDSAAVFDVWREPFTAPFARSEQLTSSSRKEPAHD